MQFGIAFLLSLAFVVRVELLVALFITGTPFDFLEVSREIYLLVII